MEPRGLTSLPVEVIHHISSYLSVQDVLSCSLTCHYLRNALNDNYVWKQYLPPGVSCLETKEQHVIPALYIDESLSPLCENRQHFVRKTHLINNWREGHCVQFRSTSKCMLRIELFNTIEGKKDMLFDDKYFFCVRFINNFESGDIEVWDISNIPVCHTVFKLNDGDYDRSFIIDSYLVVVVCIIKVFVYHINLPEKDFPLAFSFLITDDLVTLNQRVEHSGRDDERCKFWVHSVVKNYLISSNQCENVLHIWDIHNASKICSIEPPIECLQIHVHSCVGKNIFFEVLQSSTLNYLSIFDIEKMQFNDQMLSCSRTSYKLIFNKYVILFNVVFNNPEGGHRTICSIFDFSSSLKLKERSFVNDFERSRFDLVTIVNGRFIILCNDGYHIVDALTLETVDTFKCDGQPIIIKEMVLFESFLVISASHLGMKLVLWDINRKNKLSIDLKELFTHFYLDRLCTKLVSMNEYSVSVVHFW